MLSETQYWGILGLGLFAFTSIVWWYLIPYQIIDYSIGINLLTDSIGMVLSVVFFSFLLNVRDNREWKKVKERVLLAIGSETGMIVYIILFLVKEGQESLVKLLSQEEVQAAKELFLNELTRLKDQEVIIFDKDLLAIYLGDEKVLRGSFIMEANRLGEIQARYFKFLQPEVVMSLMRIEDHIRHLISISDMYRAENVIPWKREAQSIDFWTPKVAKVVSKIVTEIYKIHQIGIEVFPFKPWE